MSVYQGGSSASQPISGYGGGNAPWHRWQDWVNLILGIWLFISPWVYATTSAVAKSHSEWNCWILGIIVVVMALWALSQPEQRFPEWINVIAGIWLFIAPWALGFSTVFHSAAMNQWVVGVIVFILAIWAQNDARQGTVRA
jgi:uncharacterized membrane protein